MSRDLESRGADALALQLIYDLVGCGAELSPWGRQELAEIEASCDTDPVSGVVRFRDPGTRSRVASLSSQLEAYVADLWVVHSGGYRIVRPHPGGPLSR